VLRPNGSLFLTNGSIMNIENRIRSSRTTLGLFSTNYLWQFARKLDAHGLASGLQTLVPLSAVFFGFAAFAQLPDKTLAPNTAGEGINKSFADQVGAGRGDLMTPDSSWFIIARDPFRAIRRGRQLFQRKFNRVQGHGPNTGDGVGDMDADKSIGAGLSDSCASCHGRPRGAAGSGGDVVTRPDSRDSPHLFGLGLQEMLGDEITFDLRSIRYNAIASARATGQAVERPLVSKGISFGTIRAMADGSVDTRDVQGVDPDLRVRPFFAEGSTISIREFVAGAFNAELGLESFDPELAAAAAGGSITTPSGMVLDGAKDKIEAPTASSPTDDPDGDGVLDEMPVAILDYMEFYLLNYFKPAVHKQDAAAMQGLRTFQEIGCASCHVQNLMIERDRRVADVETVYDPGRGIFNRLFATAEAKIRFQDRRQRLPRH
jgi:mono/diheme cytochrome c family protein